MINNENVAHGHLNQRDLVRDPANLNTLLLGDEHGPIDILHQEFDEKFIVPGIEQFLEAWSVIVDSLSSDDWVEATEHHRNFFSRGMDHSLDKFSGPSALAHMDTLSELADEFCLAMFEFAQDYLKQARVRAIGLYCTNAIELNEWSERQVRLDPPDS